jgi:hypothetical protein
MPVDTVTVPTWKPASSNVKFTVPNGCPMKLGMMKLWGCKEDAIKRLIRGAETPFAFAGGLWETTWSGVFPGN